MGTPATPGGRVGAGDAGGDARVELDYAHTTELLRTLLDVRFKLLTFVPTIAGAAVAFLGHGRSASELVAVGAIGLAGTLGIALYELRNTELHDYTLHRAQELEQRLGIGLYRERPAHGIRLFGLTSVAHDRALALVYGAAIAGWTYLLAWGALRALDVGHPRDVGALIGLAAGIAVVAEFTRIERRPG